MPQPLLLKPAQLRLLRAIGQHGKLQLAAEACAMSQPAASRMLAEIERLMRLPLFLRRPKGLEPTEAGRLVLRRSAVILHELDRMRGDVAGLRAGNAGTVRVGAVTGPAISYLVTAIRAIKARAPAAEIAVEVLPTRDLLTRLLAGELDFAIGRILPDFDTGDFQITPMQDEKLSFLVRAGHPLARAPRVTLTETLEAEWIMQGRGAPVREATIQAFAALGLPEPRNIVHSASLLFTIAYLAQCDAIAPVSSEVAALLMQPPINAGLHVLNIRAVPPVAPYFLLHMRRQPLSPLAAQLFEAVLRCQREGQKAATGAG